MRSEFELRQATPGAQPSDQCGILFINQPTPLFRSTSAQNEQRKKSNISFIMSMLSLLADAEGKITSECSVYAGFLDDALFWRLAGDLNLKLKCVPGVRRCCGTAAPGLLEPVASILRSAGTAGSGSCTLLNFRKPRASGCLPTTCIVSSGLPVQLTFLAFPMRRARRTLRRRAVPESPTREEGCSARAGSSGSPA